MSGGTQVTTTTTQPWEAQEPYLIEGMKLAAGMREGGEFTPAAYGAPGTMAPWVQALQGTPQMTAPGLAGFSPQQQAAMDAITAYSMGERPATMMQRAETGLFGGPETLGTLPYSQALMGYGAGAAGVGPGQYGGILPFEGDQYAEMLRGDVDYDAGPFGRMADVYREQAEDQMQKALANVRGQQVLYQPGGGSRGDIFAAQAAATGQKALAQNLAGLYGGAYQQAMAGRMPAAQMGLGAQQFGMGYGLQGLQGAQGALGMYPGMMQAPLGMFGAAQGIGEQQRALTQAALNRDIARYEYQSQLPQQGLQSYLAGVSGDYGGLTTSRGPGGTGGVETAIAALIGSMI